MQILQRLFYVFKLCYFVTLNGSAIFLLYLALNFIGDSLEQRGVFDNKTVVQVTCTDRKKTDGLTKFHGQENFIVSAQEKEVVRVCEKELDSNHISKDINETIKEALETDKEFDPYAIDTIGPSDPFNVLKSLKRDCYASLKMAVENFKSHYYAECKNAPFGSKQKKVLTKKSYYFFAPHLDNFIISALIYFFVYVFGYIVFGYSTISPFKLWRSIRGEN
ncbi:MAG: hypothetical protein ACJZ8S_00205 [Paracoccaceae bacterium]